MRDVRGVRGDVSVRAVVPIPEEALALVSVVRVRTRGNIQRGDIQAGVGSSCPLFAQVLCGTLDPPVPQGSTLEVNGVDGEDIDPRPQNNRGHYRDHFEGSWGRGRSYVN